MLYHFLGDRQESFGLTFECEVGGVTRSAHGTTTMAHSIEKHRIVLLIPKAEI